ncbi:N-acetylmuramoyl-L-alanine amidase, partial [Gemmatimonadota bacterium]
GPGGTVEKEVAFEIASTIAEILRREEGLEVHLTRETDTLVPLWKRGEQATEWKSDRPAGVFVSIHANAMPNSSSVRGFETYFLSEARTEHERRVAALENAASEFETEEDSSQSGTDLGFILSELRSLDHQHWSALLAELVQAELREVHPGPNRGVKQGPFAVITNALMPAVLIEVGFISNPQEERLLAEREFQEDVAGAVTAAVLEFFRRYPGGTSDPWGADAGSDPERGGEGR